MQYKYKQGIIKHQFAEPRRYRIFYKQERDRSCRYHMFKHLLQLPSARPYQLARLPSRSHLPLKSRTSRQEQQKSAQQNAKSSTNSESMRQMYTIPHHKNAMNSIMQHKIHNSKAKTSSSLYTHTPSLPTSQCYLPIR
jgi:hypothetical protein